MRKREKGEALANFRLPSHRFNYPLCRIINYKMQTILLLASLLIASANSLCAGSTYWNPLNNACVNCKPSITQSAPGNHPTFTTRILPPKSAF